MQLIILIGVSGSGKTTVGKQLAARLNWQFQDADDYHSAANQAKMQQGIALTDADRLPWLRSLQDAIAAWSHAQRPTVLACSALKASYRHSLQSALSPDIPLTWVYLKGDFETIKRRLQQRQQSEPDHFMNPGLLHSQFDTLEEPQQAIQIDIRQSSPDSTIEEILQFISML